MKKFALVAIAVIGMALTGCASYSDSETEERSAKEAEELTRTITMTLPDGGTVDCVLYGNRETSAKSIDCIEATYVPAPQSY